MQSELHGLFIDDNLADRSLATLALGRGNPPLRVDAVRGYSEFQRYLDDGGFDFVVTDLHLGWSNGLLVLSEVRRRYPTIPVLFFCGALSPEEEGRVIDAGPDEILLKNSMNYLRLGTLIRSAVKRGAQVQGAVSQSLQSLCERAKVGIFRADHRGRLLEVNGAMVQLLGCRSREDALEKRLELHFRSKTSEELLQRSGEEGSCHRGVIEVESPAGKRLLAVTETVSASNGDEIQIEGLVSEPSAEAGQQGAEATNGGMDFAQVAAHELQEPARTVERYAKLLEKDGVGLDEEGREHLGFISEGAQQMQRMIEDLLVYSRLEQPGEPAAQCDPAQALQGAVDRLRASIEEHRADISWSHLPMVWAEPQQLRIVFQNLIANAIKFRSPGTTPRIYISAERVGKEEVFSVRDNGIGIEQDQLEAVFERFKRLDKKYPGSGLGLSICKRIVEGHGGRIWVRSRRERGSTFFFALPVRPGR